jgi:hypothetical protein
VHGLHPSWQRWAQDVPVVLTEANAATVAVLAAGRTQLDPDLLAELRRRYDAPVRWG